MVSQMIKREMNTMREIVTPVSGLRRLVRILFQFICFCQLFLHCSPLQQQQQQQEVFIPTEVKSPTKKLSVDYREYRHYALKLKAQLRAIDWRYNMTFDIESDILDIILARFVVTMRSDCVEASFMNSRALLIFTCLSDPEKN